MRQIIGLLVALALSGCNYGITRIVPDMPERLIGKTIVLKIVPSGEEGSTCEREVGMVGVLACVGIATSPANARAMGAQIGAVECVVYAGPSQAAIVHELGVCAEPETYWNMRR